MTASRARWGVSQARGSGVAVPYARRGGRRSPFGASACRVSECALPRCHATLLTGLVTGAHGTLRRDRPPAPSRATTGRSLDLEQGRASTAHRPGIEMPDPWISKAQAGAEQLTM